MIKFITLLTLSWPAGHICPTYKESFQVRWDNIIPLFLHAAIYLEVSLFRWTSQNAFSRETAVYKWYCVQRCIAGRICPTYKESFQSSWDNSIPLFLHVAIYLEVSLFRWTSQNAFSRETAVYKWYCVQCCIAGLICPTYKESFQVSWDNGIPLFIHEKNKWDTVIPADLKRLFVSGTYMSCCSRKG